MRGEDCYFDRALNWLGITPAHAGRSGLPSIDRGHSWDHPRACGEKGYTKNKGVYRLGSPPRMRGEAHEEKFGEEFKRITPAHAGRR